MDDETRAALIDACGAHQRNLSAFVVLSELLQLPELRDVPPRLGPQQPDEKDPATVHRFRVVNAARLWLRRAGEV